MSSSDTPQPSFLLEIYCSHCGWVKRPVNPLSHTYCQCGRTLTKPSPELVAYAGQQQLIPNSETA